MLAAPTPNGSAITMMTDISPLIPRQPVPSLVVLIAGGGKFDLASENPKNFTLVAFYRGQASGI
jgi:hypothetical protein